MTLEEKSADVVKDLIIKHLDVLTPENRVEVFQEYCVSCGEKNPICSCWKEEV